VTTTCTAAGQRTRLLDASNRQTSYPDSTISTQTYDGAGHVLSRIDQAGKATRYIYDDTGLLHTVTNPLTQATTYAYDTRGNLTSILDANSHSTTFGYDALSRPVTETLPLTWRRLGV